MRYNLTSGFDDILVTSVLEHECGGKEMVTCFSAAKWRRGVYHSESNKVIMQQLRHIHLLNNSPSLQC